MEASETKRPTRSPKESITYCVFSFNRAQFLQNCIESIQRAVPFSDIWVFDDQSDDPDTQAYLHQIEEQVTVVRPGLVGKIKHGGLYHNMQLALETLQERPLLCFLQDDTQVIRPISTEEIVQINALFDETPELGFVHPCFIRGIDLTRHPVEHQPGPTDSTFYRKDTGQSAGIHYSDLFISRPERLITQGWHFFQSEAQNDAQAKALFGPMAYLYSPFAMWLPEVPAWRGKRKTLGLKLAEDKKQCGFYPFKLWSEAQAERFSNRDPKVPPIAETFLECTPNTPPTPWTYNPLTGLRGLKLLNNIETYLRRMLNL